MRAFLSGMYPLLLAHDGLPSPKLTRWHSRNCTKHKIRCPYNDVPAAEDRAGTPEKPDLMWTPENEAAIEKWRQTGVFPFPSLNIYPAPAPQLLTKEELRLIHHVASISHQMMEIGANGFTMWTRQIPT